MLDQLPTSAAPAPWEGTAAVVMWLTRAGAPASQALPPKLRSQVSALWVLAGMVRYRDTPVGSYHEVFGNLGFLRGMRPRSVVSFMAVDSPASLLGGRSNWSLPKTLATFDGDPAPGRSITAVGSDWKVGVKVTALGPAIPMRSTLTLEQQWPDGTVRPCTLRLGGRGRLAFATVDVEASASFSNWLRSGRHLGMVFEEVRFSMARAGNPT